GDLISALIEVEEEGSRLTEEELSSAISTIYTAAGTTTERLISSGIMLLLTYPDQWEAVKADRKLIDPALEEMLRFITRSSPPPPTGAAHWIRRLAARPFAQATRCVLVWVLQTATRKSFRTRTVSTFIA